MIELSELHRRAMAQAEEAALLRLQGRTAEAAELTRAAFNGEREAAALTAARLDLEPTRSVLHRSAASLALECRDEREAERLIATALAGNPPAEIADELRDLLEQVYLQRHLDLRGLVLSPSEFQLSLIGGGVGHGVTESEPFVSRVQVLDKLIFRTAERRARRPFRERGRRQLRLARGVEVFLSVPRAASFAVTFRLGHSEQLTLPGVGLAEEVVTELLDCLELYIGPDAQPLRQRIDDDAYYRNFVSLARGLAPDGVSVRTVGLTATGARGERRIVLEPAQGKESADLLVAPPEPNRERVSVRGTLRLADALKEGREQIVLQDEARRKHRVRVPTGMMDDIVRPLWDFEVVVTGVRQFGEILLDDIRRVDHVE